jgi:O-antigen ligase
LLWRSSPPAGRVAVSDQSRPGFALRSGPMTRVAIAALVPVAIGVFAEGGYSGGARVAFGVAGVCAGLLAARRGAAREPVVLVLMALAALGLLSALWTLGPVDRTVRWALVCAGYAGVAVAAAAVARRRGGVELLAGAVAAIAVGAGLAGLIAVLLHAPPYAERIAGVWRPGGPFEYPPALALLEVSALPALLAALSSRKRLVVATGAFGLAVAVCVLALAASRTALAFAVVVVGIWALRRLRPDVRLRLVLPFVLVAALLAGGLAFGVSAEQGAGPSTGFLHGRASTWRAAVDTFADRPLRGAGADAFLAGSARHQGGETVVFAHDLPLELAAELGVAGAALAVALYAAVGRTLWRVRGTRAFVLLGPSAAAFLLAGLVDWPWHLAGCGAIWALSVGTLTGVREGAEKRASPNELRGEA